MVNLKDKFLKIGLPIVIVIIVTISLLLYFLLPKAQSQQLTITTKDITMSVGEEVPINYTVSNPYATVTFKIENNEIVSISHNRIKAIKIGSTKITLTAKFSNTYETAVCYVLVKNQTPQEPSEPINPNEPESPIPPPKEEDYASIKIIPEINCEFINDTLFVQKDISCYIQFKFEIEQNHIYYEQISTGNFTINSCENIITQKAFDGYALQITAKENGTIKFMVDEKVVGIIKVKIK